MRWTHALLALALAILVVACGSPGSTTDDDDGNGGDGSQATQPAATSGDDDDDDDSDDDNGGSDRDADAAFERLTPPNAQEVSKTTASGVIIGAFTTSDSVESLTSFYEDAFDDLDLEIASTTEASGAISWFVGNDADASEFGGFVSVAPGTDGGSAVSIQIGSTN